MNAGEVKELAREWVELEGSKTPGFRGAHLMGSLVTMPRDANFDLWKDVDLALVVPDGSGYESGRENVILLHKGLILEVSYHEETDYRFLASVLTNPEYTHCFAMDSVLSDPTGMLYDLHDAVVQEWSRRQWVLARCEYEKREFWECIGSERQIDSAADAFRRTGWAMCYLAGLVAVACLRQPTHRRCLILMRKLLETRGKSELCEETLRILGCSQMSREQVESYLQDAAEAFDRAVEVKLTPSPFGFKLHPHVRPYLVEAARSMIDEGYHREAMWWIAGFYDLSNAAIQNDAPEKVKAWFRARSDHLLADLGLCTSENCAARVGQARALAERVFQAVDEIVTHNPDIVD